MARQTFQQYLDRNPEVAKEIQAEAKEYAKNYNCDMATALRDVRDEYYCGWAEGMEALRTNDWDYLQE